MPLLRLSPDEVRDLKLALEVRVHALGIELEGADAGDYRVLLRERQARLEGIIARLDDGTPAGSLTGS